MFASTCSRVLRVARGSCSILGKTACVRPLPGPPALNPSFVLCRTFSKAVDDGKKVVATEKATQEAMQKVAQKPPVSKLRQTVAGLCIGFAASALSFCDNNLTVNPFFQFRDMRYNAYESVAFGKLCKCFYRLLQRFFIKRAEPLVHKHGIQPNGGSGAGAGLLISVRFE